MVEGIPCREQRSHSTGCSSLLSCQRSVMESTISTVTIIFVGSSTLSEAAISPQCLPLLRARVRTSRGKHRTRKSDVCADTDKNLYRMVRSWAFPIEIIMSLQGWQISRCPQWYTRWITARAARTVCPFGGPLLRPRSHSSYCTTETACPHGPCS